MSHSILCVIKCLHELHHAKVIFVRQNSEDRTGLEGTGAFRGVFSLVLDIVLLWVMKRLTSSQLEK